MDSPKTAIAWYEDPVDLRDRNIDGKVDSQHLVIVTPRFQVKARQSKVNSYDVTAVVFL